MTGQEVVDRCKVLYVEIAEMEKEEEAHKERGKACRKRIDAHLGQIRALVTGTDTSQTEIPLAEVSVPDEIQCADGAEHAWRQNGESEYGVGVCTRCGAVKRFSEETQEWIYSFPPPAEKPTETPAETPAGEVEIEVVH